MSRPRRSLQQSHAFSSPETEIVWAGIQKMDIAARTELLELLSAEIYVRPFLESTVASREARAVLALREVQSLLGHSPSVREYEQARANDPTHQWPPEGRIRTWLGAGTWNAALERAGLQPVAGGGEFIVRAKIGRGFTEDELVAALKAAKVDLGYAPTWHEYASWARRPDVQRRPGRRPLSVQPFGKAFGGFPQALAGAGLADGEVCVSHTGAVRPVQPHTREKVIEALREVADRLGFVPTSTEYARERKMIEDESRPTGLRSIPSVDAISRLFGSFVTALIESGLVTPTEGFASRRPVYGDDELLALLREAYQAIGDPFTSPAYVEWRMQERVRQEARVAKGERARHIASYELIRRRFGTWLKACRRAGVPTGRTNKRANPT